MMDSMATSNTIREKTNKERSMRMWMVPPSKMCRKHLLGEHVELHMIAACLRLGKSIRGYVETGLI